MWVYCFLLLIPLAIQHFTIRVDGIDYQKKNSRALFFFFAMMTVLVALRHETIGKDTRNYIYYFDRFSELSWEQCANESVEVGFAYFSKIISVFTEAPQVLFAITAVVTVAMIYPTYKRLCIDPSLTIVLYVTMSTFVMMFSGIRQMLAIGIGFLAYECARNKKLIFFILLSFVMIRAHFALAITRVYLLSLSFPFSSSDFFKSS